jgi:glycosyltransferase involved in cell wall biosynthesis
MPVYNCELYVSEAIESILNQTFRDFELIIIDDNSTDDTREIVRTFSDGRIRLIEKPINTGYTASLNMGINISHGVLIARMDGDDISNLNRFEKQVTLFAQHPDVVVCGTWYEIISTNELIKYPIDHEGIKVALLDYCALGHPTVMLRKSFLLKHQLKYDETLEPAEDYDLWTRIVALGKLANVPEVLLKYRDHSNQVSITDQYKQNENSIVSKLRMIRFPLTNLTESDQFLSRMIIEKERIPNAKKLREVLNWLDWLFLSNRQSGFYIDNEFEKYITNKKIGLTRLFYLHNTAYNPRVFYQFIKLKGGFKECFTLNEFIRFFTKCMVFWKLNPQSN